MRKSGRGVQGAAPAQIVFVPVASSPARAAQFIEAVKSLKLPRVRFSKGTGRAQFVMADGTIAVTQVREDYNGEWPFFAVQDGRTLPTFWKMWFVPTSELEVEG